MPKVYHRRVNAAIAAFDVEPPPRPQAAPKADMPKGNGRKARMERYLLARSLDA
jgi:hypothetical protein